MPRTAMILASFFLSLHCFSQITGSGGQFPFVHYTPKDGLVNSRVRKAYQDSKGLMYFLTAGGLSVYDGARFRNYTAQQGLPIDIVNDVLEVGDDSLLIAANTGALNALVKGRIVTIKTEGEHCPTINEFYPFDQNTIYLACDDGLFSLRNKKVTHLDISLMQNTNSDAPYLGNITGAGNYLLFTTHELRRRKGLYLYDIRNNRISDLLPELGVYLLGKDDHNYVWVSVSDKLFVLNRDSLSRGKLLLEKPPAGYSQAKNYSAITADFGRNAVWLVYRENSKNQEIRRVEENGSLMKMALPGQALNSDIRKIFIDRENNIWLCNDGEGVFKIANSPLQIFRNPFAELTGGFIGSPYYSEQVTWYKTNSSRLLRVGPGKPEVFTSNLKESPVVFYENGNRLLARDYKNIYEGELTGQGLILFRKIISLTAPDFFPGVVRVDRNGFIITSTISALCVWKNRNMVLRFPVVKNDLVEALEFDKKNLLWIVKRHGGIEVCSLHPEDPPNYLQPVRQFAPEQLIGSPRSFTMDKNGRLWIGTRDHGLICYEQKGDQLEKLYQFNVSNGLTDNFVTALGCDSSNNIIVGTQTGLDRILFDQGGSHRIENLSKSANFFALINEIWADDKRSYALTNSGDLFELSLVGEPKSSIAPQLLLEEIRINAQAATTAKQSFGYRQNNLSFLIAAPSFIDEKQVRYTYLLDGSGNKQWTDTAASNSMINLSNLSPGKYVLKVKAFFPSALYAPAELSYQFEITPPWWQTWWAKLLAALLIVGFLFVAIRFYFKRKLEKQMAALEKQQAIEKERTRIATDMHDDLGAGLSRIKFLSETIGIKKQTEQPIEEDISKIREYSHEMIDKMGEIVWALNEKNDSLSDLLSYSRAYAVEYLSQSGIDCEVIAPENFPAVFVSGEFRRNIYLVLKEALHNIVKHAQASHVKIRIDTGQKLSIVIRDDGIGFDKNRLRPFSNGLSNMEKRMQDIGGSIQIKNENGTVVILLAPIT